MRIQELEQLVGADRATIRYYEKEGLIAPNRSENGYRDYTQENAQELKRILLLRQLGVSVFSISQLQKGNVDLQTVLEEQIRLLTRQIRDGKRAKAVCETIREDGIAYAGFDAEHYRRLYEEIQVDEPVDLSGNFREKLPKEIHPWRRYIGRYLDFSLFSGCITFFVVVILRIRPVPGNFLNTLITILAGMAFVLIEAYMLSRWGTTPGKYVMGIRLEAAEGGNLSFVQARNRAWGVLRDGMCFYIPLLTLWSLVKCYLQLTGRTFRRFARREDIDEPEEMPWNNETEIIYEPLTRKRGVGLVALVLMLAVMIGISTADSIKPRYRGSELTVAQFAENYNHVVDILNDQRGDHQKLQPDGTKEPIPDNVVHLSVGADPVDEAQRNFIYEVEDGVIRSIAIYKEWTDVSYCEPMTQADTVILSFAVLLGQRGFGFGDLLTFAEEMDKCADLQSGTMRYADILISWEIEYENLEFRDGYYFSEEDDGRLSFAYQIQLK